MSAVGNVLVTENLLSGGKYNYAWQGTDITVNRQLMADDFVMEEPPLTPPREPIILGTSGDTWGNATDMNAADYNGGDDTVSGGDGNDTLMGGAGNDMLKGDAGDDTLMGGAGNDELTGGLGNDTFQIDASADYDMITDFRDGDRIMLGNQLATAAEVQTVLGTEAQGVGGGYAYMWMGTSFEVSRKLMSEDFKQVAVAPDPTITLVAGQVNWPATGEVNTADDKVEGNDLGNNIMGGDGNDTLMGGVGNDTLMGGDDEDRLMGDAGDDSLTGGDDDDTLMGGDGNDTLMGGDEDDRLMGDAGDDSLTGGDDDDTLMGGPGNDTLMGGDHDDTLDGGPGYDDLDSGNGDDTVNADADDVSEIDASGSPRTPMVVGGPAGGTGTDTLSFELSTAAINDGQGRAGGTGTAGAYEVDDSFENVIGSSHGDMLSATSGRSTSIELTGGDGNDTLTGGAGNDKLDGGLGRDELTGGGGSDVFVWGDGDVTTDFDPAVDTFDTSALGVLARSDIMLTADFQGGVSGVTVTIDGESMFLEGETLIGAGSIGTGDFIM